MFCKDNQVIGASYKMNGTGILQLPNGCTLSVTDHKDRNSKVKGQPLYRMIDAEDIDLIASGPLKALKSSMGPEGIHKMSTYGELFHEHMSSVVQQVASVDGKITNHSNYIWGLIGVTSVILTLTIAVVMVLYKYSGKFRQKVWDLRDKLAIVTQQLLALEIDHYGIHRGRPPPGAAPIEPPRSGDILRKIRSRVRRARAPPKVTVEHLDTTYLSMDELSTSARRREERVYQPLSVFSPAIRRETTRFYPRLTPMLRALSEAELKELDSDSQEVEELCKPQPSNLSQDPVQK